jgi:hypothetical protein
MHTETAASPPASSKDVDFFKEHEDFEITQDQSLVAAYSQPVSIGGGSAADDDG